MTSFRLNVGGGVWEGGRASGLADVEWSHALDGIETARFTLDAASDPALAALKPGLEVALWLDGICVFEGTVGSRDLVWRGPHHRLGATCIGRAHVLRGAPRTRTFDGLTDAQAVQQVVEEAGLSLRECRLLDGTRRIEVQWAETDWSLLGRLAARNGCAVWTAGHDVAIGVPGRGRPNRRVERESVVELEWTEDASDRPTSVAVAHWDWRRKVSVAPTVLLTDVDGVAGGRPSPGFRDCVVLHDVGSDGQAVAETVAEHEAAARARDGVRGRLVLAGDPSWRVGDVLHIADMSWVVGGPLLVTRVRHRVTAGRGFSTELFVCGSAAGEET